MEVRKDIQPVIDKNKAKLAAAEAYETFQQAVDGPGNGTTRLADFMEHILEMREYDVPYHVRFAIDNGESAHVVGYLLRLLRGSTGHVIGRL